LPCQLELLLGIEWCSIGDVARIKVGNHSDDALSLLFLNLFLRDLLLRQMHAHLGDHRSQFELDERNQVALVVGQGSGYRLCLKSRKSDAQFEGAGCNISK